MTSATRLSLVKIDSLEFIAQNHDSGDIQAKDSKKLMHNENNNTEYRIQRTYQWVTFSKKRLSVQVK